MPHARRARWSLDSILFLVYNNDLPLIIVLLGDERHTGRNQGAKHRGVAWYE